MGLFSFKRKDEREGWAEVVECWSVQTKRAVAASNCKMKLKLDVPGIEPMIVKHHEPIMNTNRWPEVGMRVAVTVDANKPDKVDCHWESVFGEMHGGAVGGRLAELALGVAGIDADLSKGVKDESSPVDPRDAGKDPQTLVTELNASFARGEITYEEMSDRLMRALNS